MAQGYSASETASILGVPPKWVAEQVNKPEVKEAILGVQEELLSAEVEEEESISMRMDQAIHKLITNITKQADFAELPALSHALRTVGDLKEKRLLRKNPIQQPSTGNTYNTMLNVTIPTHAALPAYTKNSLNQIVGIGEGTMTPLSSEGVKSLFSSLSAPVEKEIVSNNEF